MGITERREREREEVRRKILEAARELFATEGYERVTMRRIAEAIEYSPTTIYNHFEDKNALVDALCEEDFSRLLRSMGARELPADPIERILQLGQAYARFGLENPNHYRYMFMTPFEQKACADHELSPSGEAAFGLLHDAVREAVRAGRFVPVEPLAAAQVLWASLHGVVALLITYRPEKFPHGAAAPDLVERVMENGLRGFLAPGSR
ncbi:MAG TPA: TetR/AcrR family transcriptional regulator [Vicinamibacteria bacterium]|nr:TetR/AcrR family transcriptional regulator [Vicinamibacteria bacterium]